MADLYLIDANVMIQAANTYYSFDHVPGFWSWLEGEILGGRVRTASLVADEVNHPPELVSWIDAQQENGFYVDVSEPAVQAAFKTIASWLVAQRYGPEHMATFLNGADAWIIAAASVVGAVVVTQEQRVPADSRKVKIPNVCEAFGVQWVDTFGLLDELGARLTP